MDKTTSNQLQEQMIMKCPRCDSSNTKFCYYNNYSLSQPRHFCKACKRYWTRGGTLRNVPVGGGCRKNKKFKKPTTTKTTTSSSANMEEIVVSVTNPNSMTQTHLDVPTNNTVLYGLPTHRSDLGFGRLGFSSALFNDSDSNILSSYNNSSTNSLLTSTSPRMVSDLMSCPNNTGESYGFQRPYLIEGLQMETTTMASKEEKANQNKLDLWDELVPSYCQNQMGQINPSIQHHTSSLYWNPPMTWLDPSIVDFSSN